MTREIMKKILTGAECWNNVNYSVSARSRYYRFVTYLYYTVYRCNSTVYDRVIYYDRRRLKESFI